MDGDDMQRLWSLIEDLTNQLQANRQLCESLQQQADQLRGQAIHSGTGFALRRFNTDLSKEKFESELEALNVHLVKENLSLSHENKQQAVLLREYENTLETVMAKFRSFSHSTQQHTLQLTQHYESLLAQTAHNAAEQTLAAETAFSGTLTHLGGLVRRAMQSLDGEVSDDEAEEDEEGRPRNTKRGWVQDPKWYGSGGYVGKMADPVALRADEALEHLTEEERLRMENDTLRELLGLKEKSDALLSNAPSSESQSGPAASASIKAMSPAERRASLTVDEAAIAAEASGQPSSKTLQVSSITRPGEEASDATASPSRASPKITPALERKDQIIEEAILADEENVADRGRRPTESSPSMNSDITAFKSDQSIPTSTASLPLVFASDDAESAPSSIEELRAAAKQEDEATQAPSAAQGGSDADADEITPIDEVDAATTAASGANLVAEAAPPALVGTGIEESDATVTSASGIDVAEATSAESSPAISSVSIAPSDTSSSSNDTSPSSVAAATTADASDGIALATKEAKKAVPPAESAEGDFQPIVTSAEAPAAEPTKDNVHASIPAEPTKADNKSASPQVAEAKLTTPLIDGTDGTKDEKMNEEKEKEAKGATTEKEVKTPGTPNQGNKKPDGSASPKKNNRNRGKNRHNKSNSSANNRNN